MISDDGATSPRPVPAAARSAAPATSDVLRVLAVDDDPDIRWLLTRSLTAAGYEVECAADVAAARVALRRLPHPDVVLIDVRLPDGDGFTLLREVVEARHSEAIMVTGVDHEADRVRGLSMGAADYVAKPFFPRELALRIRRVAADRRRAAAPPAPRHVVSGALAIDLETREVHLDGGLVPLARKEFDLLATLAAAAPRSFTRAELLEAVWHSRPDWQSAKTVTEHIRRLRQKIEPDPLHPRWILTVASGGYRFEP